MRSLMRPSPHRFEAMACHGRAGSDTYNFRVDGGRAFPGVGSVGRLPKLRTLPERRPPLMRDLRSRHSNGPHDFPKPGVQYRDITSY